MQIKGKCYNDKWIREIQVTLKLKIFINKLCTLYKYLLLITCVENVNMTRLASILVVLNILPVKGGTGSILASNLADPGFCIWNQNDRNSVKNV